VLSGRVYAGELTFGGITATGCHDPFVEESVFDEAERILGSRSQSPVRLISVATTRPTPRGRPRPPRAGQPAWSFAPERAHLNRVVPSDRMRGRELDRLLPISAADDVDAGDELLGLDERPVAEQRLPVADADRRRSACAGRAPGRGQPTGGP
jgi:hypothetical protein